MLAVGLGAGRVEKLGVNDRAAAVGEAYQRRLLT
jgi:hypothetical protein